MDDRERIDRAIRHFEAKLMKAVHGPASSRDLAALEALHKQRRRLLQSAPTGRNPHDFSS
jgi:hypothetical protein